MLKCLYPQLADDLDPEEYPEAFTDPVTDVSDEAIDELFETIALCC